MLQTTRTVNGILRSSLHWFARFVTIAGAVACALTAIYLFWSTFLVPFDAALEPERGFFVRASTIFEEITGVSAEGTEAIKHQFVPAEDYSGRDFLRVTYSDDLWVKNFLSAANAKEISASVDWSPERSWWDYGQISELKAFESKRGFIFWIDRPNRHLFIFHHIEQHTIL